ncbi:MAG: hypothetical protein KC561_02145 [Myxococcales bacterium]|nr:hypothetical protein [Myxococcales bacterium]
MGQRTTVCGSGAVIFAWLVIAAATVGCGGTQTDTQPNVQRARYGNLSTEGMRLVESDLDFDGVTDQFTYYGPNDRIVRAERDIDFDGRVDVFEYYDQSGVVIEHELLLDFDNMVDAVRFYQDGQLVRREISVGFGSDFSVLKYYDASGNVLRVERDSTGNGQIDTWEYFDNNVVSRIGRDEDGDGVPEIMESAE